MDSYVVHADNVLPDGTFGSNANEFTVHLPTPLTDVVEVQMLSASFHQTGTSSNVAYIVVDELKSQLNVRAGTIASNGTVTTSRASDAIAKVHVDGEVRTNFKGNEWPTPTTYRSPIPSISRLTISVYDQTGSALLDLAGPSFVSFNILCAKRTPDNFIM